jgi:hypothetical protein
VTAVVLALACSQLAPPGAGWAATLLPGVVAVLAPRHGTKIAGAMIGAVLFGLLVLAQTSPALLGHRLRYDPAWPALGEGYFLFGSWNLLWLGVIAAALLAWRDLLLPPLVPLTAIVCAAATLLFALVAFPDARTLVAAQTSVGRATLQLAPVLVVFAALAFRSFALRRADAPPSGRAESA